MELDQTELFHGKELSEKDRQLTEALERVEQKHIDYFKARPSKRLNEEHDRINMHYWTLISDGVIQFNINPDSDLPQYIKDDCIKAAKEILQP